MNKKITIFKLDQNWFFDSSYPEFLTVGSEKTIGLEVTNSVLETQ